MALNQMQTIQSLGNNLAMLQQEVEVFGVSATETRHLVGRIEELYACVITNGQMAPNTNEKGYDVVSSQGERISVKTTATVKNQGGANFNMNTLEFVDRIMSDENTEKATKLMSNGTIAYSKLTEGGRENADLNKIPVVIEVQYEGYRLVEHENGSIAVHDKDRMIQPTKPVLRKLATLLNLPLLNSNGNEFNTRTLGSLVIKSVVEGK